jgi:hypothetical protein
MIDDSYIRAKNELQKEMYKWYDLLLEAEKNQLPEVEVRRDLYEHYKELWQDRLEFIRKHS